MKSELAKKVDNEETMAMLSDGIEFTVHEHDLHSGSAFGELAVKVFGGTHVELGLFCRYRDAFDICLRVILRLLRFLAGKNRETRETLLQKLKPSLCDFFIPSKPVTAWARMDSELLARFNRGLKQYPQMLQQLEAHMRSGDPLGEEFAPDFGGV